MSRPFVDMLTKEVCSSYSTLSHPLDRESMLMEEKFFYLVAPFCVKFNYLSVNLHLYMFRS